MLVAMRTGSEQNLLPWILGLAQKWERATWAQIEVEREHFSKHIMYFKNLQACCLCAPYPALYFNALFILLYQDKCQLLYIVYSI